MNVVFLLCYYGEAGLYLVVAVIRNSTYLKKTFVKEV